MIREAELHDDDVLPQLLDEREAAKILRAKRATVRAERVQGRLGYTRIGTRIFYTHQQIARYLDQQSVQACTTDATNASDKSAITGSVPNEEDVFVSYAGLKDQIGTQYSRVHLRRLIARGLFPRPVHLSPNRIAWRRSELRAWKATRRPL